MYFDERFAGKVLFATGAGSGIARAVSTRFRAEGGRVAVIDLDGDRAKTVAAELDGGSAGVGAIGIAADVSDEASVAAAVEAAVGEFGGVDCVLNAGGHTDFGLITDFSLERWNRMMAVHVGGPFLVCKHLLPILHARGGGSIVNIASIAALLAQRTNVAYGAAKAAVVGFSNQLALEAAPDVRVNSVAPGRTHTAMTEPILLARGEGDLEKGSVAFGHGNMQQRTAKAEELAAAILFLLSDDASFVTGTTLIVDGGEHTI